MRGIGFLVVGYLLIEVGVVPVVAVAVVVLVGDTGLVNVVLYTRQGLKVR